MNIVLKVQTYAFVFFQPHENGGEGQNQYPAFLTKMKRLMLSLCHRRRRYNKFKIVFKKRNRKLS